MHISACCEQIISSAYVNNFLDMNEKYAKSAKTWLIPSDLDTIWNN
jgi:hypothetical protein